MLDTEKTFLLCINLQQHLVPLIQDKDKFIENNLQIIKIADRAKIPVLLTQHKGLGDIIPEVAEIVLDEVIIEKVHFSCVADENAFQKIKQMRRDIVVITGMEAHACVLQTALDLSQIERYEVYVVEDAITSRSKEDKDAAISRLRAADINIITKEMFLFEVAKRTDTELYPQLTGIVFKKAS